MWTKYGLSYQGYNNWFKITNNNKDLCLRRGGREAEGAGLLNQYTGNCIVGSNPIPSAIALLFN